MSNTRPEKNSDCKKCRRVGEKLFLKGERCSSSKCAMIARNYAPGMHGVPGQPRKLTPYGKQLTEKQKAKAIYGIRETQLNNYYKRALKKVGNTSSAMFGFLESRLDNVVFRLGFADSRKKARQLVNHGHFLVNGKKIDIPSYNVRIGDLITIKEKSLKKPVFADLEKKLANKEVAVSWLNLDKKKLEGKFTGMPKPDEVEMSVDWQVIIEFYSR